MKLEQLIGRARRGDLDAFAEVTQRYQHMAFGYALALLRDLHQAEDVVQEAFVAAWFGLASLAEPAAFPGWLRGIVRHQAFRLLRQRHLEALPLSAAGGVSAEGHRPDQRLEQAQRIAAALGAIAQLPPPLREVVTLFYLHECSQQDIATFLGLPVTTVNNRLHAARARLKRRTLTMVKDTLEAHQLPDDFAARIGRIVRARGHVVEVLFDPASLPEVLTELTVSDDAHRRAVTVQVVQRLVNGVVRCVVTSPTETLTPGMSVLSSSRRTQASPSPDMLDTVVPVLAGLPRDPGRLPELLETGIKVIDVMCPLGRDGTVAIAGELKAGTTVVIEELVRRLSGDPGGVSLFSFAPPPPDISFSEAWRKEGYSEGTLGSVQTFYFLGEDAPWTPERLSALPGVDVVIRLSRELGRLGIYPTIDPLISRSRLLDPAVVGEEHVAIATRVRQALAALQAPAEGPLDAEAERVRQRAGKLQRFFAQPFFVAEPYTRRPGVAVSLAEALRICKEILDGLHDDLPEDAFYFTGGMEDIRARAGK
jgi:RNA polymerase sigma factor (sigma-70 family)